VAVCTALEIKLAVHDIIAGGVDEVAHAFVERSTQRLALLRHIFRSERGVGAPIFLGTFPLPLLENLEVFCFDHQWSVSSVVTSTGIHIPLVSGARPSLTVFLVYGLFNGFGG